MTSKSGSTPEALREIAAAITELTAKAKQRKLQRLIEGGKQIHVETSKPQIVLEPSENQRAC
jgi:hypothetical protein